MHIAHFDQLKSLIDLEREAEKEENKRELEKYPLHVREALGKTVTRLIIDEEDVGVGGIPLLRMSRPSAEAARGETVTLTPFHAMNQGDNVRITFPSGSEGGTCDGTLYDVGDFSVTVALDRPPPDPLPEGACQIDLIGSDATYQRMRQALVQMTRTQKPDLIRLRDILLGMAPSATDPLEPLEWFNPGLNEYQKNSVRKALSAVEVALIHGPPGTGKTTVLVEIIRQTVSRGGRVLATAPSNIAVDNLVEKLLPSGLRIVRLGHPARILEPLRHVTLSALEAEHEGRAEIERMDEERHRMIVRLRRRQDRGSGMASSERREIQDAAQHLWREARNMEFAIRRKIIQDAHVVLATHGGVNKQLERQRFDLAVLDEASQATEPLSWIPITLVKKAVFAGDSCQLPPTIYSQKAADDGLAVTLFERMKSHLSGEHQEMLRVQYRMHEDIMRFSSDRFYDGKLIADDSVRKHTAAELDGVADDPLVRSPLRFIDTAGTGYEEAWNDLLESRENEGEARLAITVLERLLALGIPTNRVAVLTPYVAQVKRLRLLSRAAGVEIGSVDSFQGREKEVVIVSLVRSNDKGEVGFLGDTRRMNVAMTRARRLLIVIGDSGTIVRHPFYEEFLKYTESIDAHTSAWEWINA